MTKKNKTLILVLPALAVLALLGVSSVSAHGFGLMGNADPEQMTEMQEQKFAHQAEILGLDVETVKKHWSEGKNMRDIMEAESIDPTEIKEKAEAQREAMMKQRMQAMVDAGIITQEQADERIENMGERGFGQGMGMKGMMSGRKGGFNGQCPFAE